MRTPPGFNVASDRPWITKPPSAVRHGRHASCALGAAYEGMYRLPDDMEGRRPTKDLEAYFDVLDGTVRACPGEGCRKVLTLSALIVHLNDDHRWSREAIAAWVENGRHGPSAEQAAERLGMPEGVHTKGPVGLLPPGPSRFLSSP